MIRQAENKVRIEGILAEVDLNPGTFKKDGKDMESIGGSISIKVNQKISGEEKELIVFRDSFGSSLIPLLAEGYQTITLVDIRYIQSEFLSNFVDFTDKDVLFLYSTVVLNNSETLK